MLHPLGNVFLAWLVVGIEVLLENHLAVVADPRRPAIKVIVPVQVGPEVVLAAGRGMPAAPSGCTRVSVQDLHFGVSWPGIRRSSTPTGGRRITAGGCS